MLCSCLKYADYICGAIFYVCKIVGVFGSVSVIPSEVARIGDFMKNVLTNQPSGDYNM